MVFAPFVGSVPWLKLIVRFSLATVVVSVGSVPTLVMLFTVVVDPAVATLMVGAETVPAGVYVAVPEEAALTVAVLFVVPFVVTETDPDGVNFPVLSVDEPVKEGFETVPAGV